MSNGWAAAAQATAQMIAAFGTTSMGIAANKKVAAQQFEYQKYLQERQQAFAENLSNTAHQREMEDLRKAGLNPLLTATGGQGASTPTTGLGSVGMTNDGELYADMGNNMQRSIQQTYENWLAHEQLKNQTKQTNAVVGLTNAQTITEEKRKDNVQLQNDLLNINKAMEEIKKSYLPEQIENELLYKTKTAQASIISAIANQTSSNAAMIEAKVNKMKKTQEILQKWQELGLEGERNTIEKEKINKDNLTKIGMAVLGAIGIGKFGAAAKLIKPAGNLIKVIPKKIPY